MSDFGPDWYFVWLARTLVEAPGWSDVAVIAQCAFHFKLPGK